jgi:uncharacterized repeat protein (TIGR01451 family)
MKSILFRVIALMVLLSMVVAPVSAHNVFQADGPDHVPDRSGFVPENATATKEQFTAVEPAEVISLSKSGRYVILFEKESLAEVSKGVEQLDATSAQSKSYLETLAKQRNQVMAAVQSTLGRTLKVAYIYDVILNGVSVELTPQEVQQLAKVPGIRKILPVTLEQPDTDAGPTWIGAPGVWSGTAVPDSVGTLGEGVLVGILDTGINFDHPSFSDTPADSFAYSWTGDYLGVCAPGVNPAYASACNKKLVGAYSYTEEAISPEDAEGHGSHTASTVAGNSVTLNFMGVSTTISGVAPHAQIISYDICDPDGCYGDASAAAVQQAILDGVNVINYSISGGKDPYNDIVELAFLEAFGEDILVAASGGNLKTEPSTDGQVNHLSPWVITVAASSHNRKFTNDIDVVSPAGSIYVDMAQIPSTSPVPFPALDNVELKWAGDDISSSTAPFADNRQGCNAFPAGFFSGKVALIRRGVCSFAIKLANAQVAGAIGMLGYADHRPPLSMGALDTATLPAGFLYLSSAEAATFADWVHTNAPVLIDMTELGRYLNDSWADIKADFSFRGPSANNLQVLKPEITAPGLEVLAAVADGVIAPDGIIEAELYGGTSMSSPHTAGSGALLSALYPSWSAAQVKSALMLTAEKEGLKKEDMASPADPFDFGSGRVDLGMASLTGLTMHETYANMVAAEPAAGGDVSALNIASLYNSLCVGECSWTRTFTSVADVAATYTVSAPAWVTVAPASFTITAGGTQAITITADVSALTADVWQFAYILFNTDSLHSSTKAISDVAIPLAVLPTTSNIPEFVRFDTHRDADSGTIPDLLASEITAGNTYESGLVKATLETFVLDPDPTNGNPIDDISQVFVKKLDIPAFSIRVVGEITASTSLDLDMFLYWDKDGDGVLSTADYLVASSATSAVLEYLNAPKSWIFYDAPDTYFLVVQNWDGAPGDTVTLATGIVPLAPEAGNYDVIVPLTNPAAEPFQIDILWNEDTEEGDRLYGYFDTCADIYCNDWIGATDLDIRRLADDVVKTADVAEALPGDTITYTIEITNYSKEATDYTINDVLPAGVSYVSDSVTGGAVYDNLTNAITWSGTVDAPGAPYYNVTDSVNDPFCDTGFGGYANLADFKIAPISAINGDSKAWTLAPGAVPYNFYGVDYPTISFTDDGFALFDAVNNYAGSPWTNQNIPDAAKPNAVVAPLWQDMEIVYDLATNKGVSIATNGPGVHIIEYDDVQIWGDPTKTYDVEIVYYHVVDDTPNYYEIVFAYDNINGPLNGATIGVENVGGTVATPYAYNNASFANGHMVCFDLVTPSATRTITFQVTVDMDADFGPLTNEALHDNNAFGTMEEAAKAVVEIVPIIAFADAYTTIEDTVLVVAAPGVLANDRDADGDTLIAVLVDNVTNGTLALASDGSFTYTPSLDFFGQDSFTYKAFDGGHYSEVVTVTITVTPVNDAPMAVDDAYTTAEDTVLVVAAPGVLANDSDADLDTMTAVLVDNVTNGTLALAPDGSFTYTPSLDFFGQDGFTYKAFDGGLYSEVVTVTITVTPVNDAPMAVADAYTTVEETQLVVLAAEGVLANDSDADLDTMTAVLVDNVTNGTLALAPDGSFTYTPGLDFFGQDGFTYKAFDGGLYSEVVTVTITITPVNDAPMAVDDAYTTAEDTVLVVAAPGVMANDVEVDADNMVVTLVSNVAHGKLVLLGDGSFTYQPAPDFFGTDTFVYRLITYPAIQSMWTDEATVTITVTEEISVVFNLYLPMIIK